MIALLIEFNLSRQTFLRGLDAIMQRTVPEDVWDDFRQHVITQPWMRENWSLTIAMTPAEDGSCVSATKIEYSIRGLQDIMTVDVHHELDSHRTTPGSSHRYTRAEIGGREYASHAELMDAGLLSEDGLMLHAPTALDKAVQPVHVELEFTERISCPDSIVWWMSRVTRNAVVKIEHLPGLWSVDVKTFHPAQHQLVRKENEGNEWAFTGIMLPGQGFEIRMKGRC